MRHLPIALALTCALILNAVGQKTPKARETQILKDYLLQLDLPNESLKKFYLIIPLGKNYYCESHLIDQFLNLDYQYKDIVVVICSNGSKIPRTITKAHAENAPYLKIDSLNYFSRHEINSGYPVLYTCSVAGVEEALLLNDSNCYQRKVKLIKELRKVRISR